MDMRIHPDLVHQLDLHTEDKTQFEKDIESCTTYDELYALIEKVGEITIDSRNYETNTKESTTYTPKEIQQIIDDVRDGKRSIYDVPMYGAKVASLLGSDRAPRPIKIVI